MWFCTVGCGPWCMVHVLDPNWILNLAFILALVASLAWAQPQRLLADLDGTFNPPLDFGLETASESSGISESWATQNVRPPHMLSL